eukprot:658720-Pyramimonas_sp.AAC.1
MLWQQQLHGYGGAVWRRQSRQDRMCRPGRSLGAASCRPRHCSMLCTSSHTTAQLPQHRTTILLQLPSQLNTWEQHYKEDLPHITYCGKIAVTQDNARRWFIREQFTGRWVDDIPPWKELADRPHITT